MYYIICQVVNKVYYYLIGNKMTNLRSLFAKNLKEKRKICGLTQAKLAEKVNVSTHHIAMIELARNFPASELIERIASALNIEIFELFLEEKLSIHTDLENLRMKIKNDMQELLNDYFNK